MLKGIPNKKYTGKFKQMVVETMPKEGMSYSEAALEFDVCDHHRIMSWERIHLEEGPEEYRQASETVQAEGRRGSDSGITKVESGECLPKKLKALALEEERQDKRRK